MLEEGFDHCQLGFKSVNLDTDSEIQSHFQKARSSGEKLGSSDAENAVVGDSIPLRMLRPGQLAEVSHVIGDPRHVHRLHELGLFRGIMIQMVHAGSPCVLRLAGHKLCFRQNELLNVLVRPAIAV